MTMLNPIPWRQLPPDLRTFLAAAHAALRTAWDELRDAAARQAGHDPATALALAQLAAAVDAVAAKVPPSWHRPLGPDRWLYEADSLHDTVTRARLGLWRVYAAADRDRPKVPVPAALAVRDGDIDLFGRVPREGAEGWGDPEDLWALQELALAAGSPADERRAAIAAASWAWARERQDRAEASGVDPLRNGSTELTGVLNGLTAAAMEMRATMPPAVRAKARLAVRAMVEEDDDTTDLAALARGYAAERGTDNLDGLAWAALADVLVMP